ncbi:MAG: hypothetical protein QM589_15895 [Thermomicrobiales bacterium]
MDRFSISELASVSATDACDQPTPVLKGAAVFAGSGGQDRDEPSDRQRRADLALVLARLSPDDLEAERIRAEINRIDGRLGASRDRERAAMVAKLETHADISFSGVLFAEIPEHLAMLERLRARASQTLERQMPGGNAHRRTQSEIDRLDMEIASFRAMVNDHDLYREVEARLHEGRARSWRAKSGRTIYLGLGCFVLGGLMLLPAVLVAGTGEFADGFGQVTFGLLVVGAILLIAGVVNTVRD